MLYPLFFLSHAPRHSGIEVAMEGLESVTDRQTDRQTERMSITSTLIILSSYVAWEQKECVNG